MSFRYIVLFFFFKQKTAYEMRISDWSSDVCSSDLLIHDFLRVVGARRLGAIGGGALGGAGERDLFDTVMADEDDKRVLGLLLGGENAASRYDSVLFEGQGDRKSVVEGKSVSVRVDRGGCRFIQKKIRKVQ